MQISQKIFKTIFYNFKHYVFGAWFASILKITAERAKFYRVLFVVHKKQFQRRFAIRARLTKKISKKSYNLSTTKKCLVSLNSYLCIKARKCIFFVRVWIFWPRRSRGLKTGEETKGTVWQKCPLNFLGDRTNYKAKDIGKITNLFCIYLFYILTMFILVFVINLPTKLEIYYLQYFNHYFSKV
jgi:hypothetical protein